MKKDKKCIKKCLTLEKLDKVYKKLKINPDVVKPRTLKKGIIVEYEHGLSNKRTNVTNNDIIKTAKIALAHILEYPDYYKRHEKMEKSAMKYWKRKKRKDIFL